MRIDATRRGKLLEVPPATPWTSPDGARKGWQLSLPGGRPLATPAAVGGRVFLGGGFGSYEFYALDADTGAQLWQHQTEDDGPTAAVVEGGYVAFNTESCELEVLTVAGERAWKKWLGDPLMSMPAVAEGRVYQVFPDSGGDRRHYLGCFDLAVGEEHWRKPLPGEVITAPVVAEGRVHVACLDGTVACFRQDTGQQLWQETRLATSSPQVWQGRCYFAQRFETEVPYAEDIWVLQQNEQLAARGHEAGSVTTPMAATATTADYLDFRKRRRSSPHYAHSETLDAGVGFAAHKGDSKMDQASSHLGHGHVSSVWAYQGSRPFPFRGRMYNAMGNTLYCVDPADQNVVWKHRLFEVEGEVVDNVLTPPAVVNGKLFVGSLRGEVSCVAAESGEVLWQVPVGEPVLFQPAVARGRVYVGTQRGNLFCIETGDAGDDGWLMWGGTAAHNGLNA
jgi:outer membrane protein assembly factor BamB